MNQWTGLSDVSGAQRTFESNTEYTVLVTIMHQNYEYFQALIKHLVFSSPYQTSSPISVSSYFHYQMLIKIETVLINLVTAGLKMNAYLSYSVLVTSILTLSYTKSTYTKNISLQ